MRSVPPLPSLIVAVAAVLWGQDAERRLEPSTLVRLIQDKAATALQYKFDATIEIARKTGEGPRETTGHFKVKLAIGLERRFLLWIGDKASLEYLIASDGRKTWAYVPSSNRYMEIEAEITGVPAPPEVLLAEAARAMAADPVLCSKLVVPLLAGLGRDAVALMEMNKVKEVNVGGRDQELPVISVLSKRNDNGSQNLAEVAIDSESMAVDQLKWSNSIQRGEEPPSFAMLDVNFEGLQLGGPISPSDFAFSPGNAEKVDQLPIPGLDASMFLNRPAPDFQVESSSHTRVASVDLRGKTVILAFTGDGCGPCRQQATALSDVQREYAKRNAVFLTGAQDQGVTYQKYGVQFVPTTVVIDPEGNVVRYLPGLRDGDALRAALHGP